jgi:phosphatidylserine/phosphatidylglycerophosphate/cardiolipin synthase-like enzyme
MKQERRNHRASLLKDGRVLVSGGFDASFTGCDSVELFDPETETWTLTGPLRIKRGGHTATLLYDGRVLVAGGFNGGTSGATLNSTEIFDPDTGSWTETAPLGSDRSGHTAILLPGGMVLIAGGFDSNFTGLTSAEIFNPCTGKWINVDTMHTARAGHTATLLPDRNVLVAGGFSYVNVPHNSAEIYQYTK